MHERLVMNHAERKYEKSLNKLPSIRFMIWLLPSLTSACIEQE